MKIRDCRYAGVLGLAGLLAMGLPQQGAAQDYPAKPIQLVVGYGAGGGTDMCFRALSAHVSKQLGQTVVVENRPGAGSSLSIAYIARQAPDGYSVAAFSMGALINQYLNAKVGYDALTDLEPIALFGQYQAGLVVRPDSPWKTVDDVLKAAKSGAGVSYSTAGVGTPMHLTMARLGELTGANLVHVPYKGGAEASLALLRGDVPAMVQTAEWAPYVRDGRLRLVTMFTDERMKGFEFAPTLKEHGYDLVAPSALGLVGPKGIPRERVRVLEEAFETAARSTEFAQCADQFGLRLDFKKAAGFDAFLKDTASRWEAVVRQVAATQP